MRQVWVRRRAIGAEGEVQRWCVRSHIVRMGVTGVGRSSRRVPKTHISLSPLRLGRGVWGAAGAQRWGEE